MRWFRRLAVALTLSTLAVAALTWAGWPRPRAVVTLALDRVESHAALCGLPCGDASAWRLVAESAPFAPDFAYWFVREDGRVAGPWRPSHPIKPFGFDRQGRLVAASQELFGDLTGDIVRYDPAAGNLATLVAVPHGDHTRVRLSRDLTALAVAVPGDPLRFDVYDVASGKVSSRVSVPGRHGSLNPDDAVVAALEWELTHDGRLLLLSEGWEGRKRTTPAGIEVWDVATGELARRLPHAGPPDSAAMLPGPPGPETDVGAMALRLTADGRAVTYVVTPRESGPPSRWSWRADLRLPPACGSDLATGRPLSTSDSAANAPTTGGTRASAAPADSPTFGRATSAGRYRWATPPGGPAGCRAFRRPFSPGGAVRRRTSITPSCPAARRACSATTSRAPRTMFPGSSGGSPCWADRPA